MKDLRRCIRCGDVATLRGTHSVWGFCSIDCVHATLVEGRANAWSFVVAEGVREAIEHRAAVIGEPGESR